MNGTIPVLPVVSGRDLFRRRRPDVPSVLDVGRPRLVSSGAEAIRGALLHAGVGPGDVVLLPAFNCPSMVTPIEALGATAAFFGITEELCFDVRAIEASLGPRARAVIVPHLFGRIQDLRAIRALCDARRLRLIEDCAHTFFGHRDGRTVGETGDYAIASPRKFMPLMEGGVLTSRMHDLTRLPVKAPGTVRAVRVAFDTVDTAAAHGRLRGMVPLIAPVKAVRRAVPASEASSAHDAPPPIRRGAAPMSRPAPVAATSWVTDLMLHHFMTQDLVERRRANFRQIHEALRNAPGLQPMMAEPGQNASLVPYMVPVLLSRPGAQIPAPEHRNSGVAVGVQSTRPLQGDRLVRGGPGPDPLPPVTRRRGADPHHRRAEIGRRRGVV